MEEFGSDESVLFFTVHHGLTDGIGVILQMIRFMQLPKK